MRYLALAALAGVLVASVAGAEIVKTASIDDPKCQGICLHWWPKVTPPKGWTQDMGASQEYNLNFMVPKDGNGDVVIYANAQQLKGQAATVAGFMADDRATFERHNKGLKVVDGPLLVTGDGQKMPTLIFNPAPGQAQPGRWEIAAYGRETDKEGNAYYLVFILSAATEAGRDQTLPVFKGVVSGYRK